jgi:hypothetical protein
VAEVRFSGRLINHTPANKMSMTKPHLVILCIILKLIFG